jgi:transposase-like protein
MRVKNKNLGNKISEWAKEYGKHFCIHDLTGFFSDVPMMNLSGMVANLTRKGQLIKASSKESCKMQTRKHLFWITSGKTNTRYAINNKKAKIPRHRWTKEEKEEVRKMFGEGVKTGEIAKHFGVSQLVIKRIIRKLSKPAGTHTKEKTTRKKRTRIRELDVCPTCLQPCRIVIIKE